MRSGMTRQPTLPRGVKPRMMISDVPAPSISAPSARKKPCRSTISGSRAALDMRVSPLAAQAAIMAFSVAPTLGMASVICAPCSAVARHTMSPPNSSTSAPSARRAFRWRSMGRGPSSQPPGILNHASPQRPATAPRKITDERMARMSSCGMEQERRRVEFICMTSPSWSTAQPRWRRMFSEASTSRSCGQFVSSVSQPVRIQAASIGSTAFFAPCTVRLPSKGAPPLTRQIFIAFPPA